MSAWDKFKKENSSREQAVLADLTKAKALFQQRAILAAMGINPDKVNHQPSTRDTDNNS